MTSKATVLSSEAMGTREFKYAAGVTREADGSFSLRIASVGPKDSHCMPAPPSLAGKDLAALTQASRAFLDAWAKAQPANKAHVLCCTKVVENAIARAKKKLEQPPGPPHGRLR